MDVLAHQGNLRRKRRGIGPREIKKSFDHLNPDIIRQILYAPRLSIAALQNHDTGISVEKLLASNLNSFIRGVVSRDFRKVFFDEIKKLRPDYLLIDSLDNMWDLLVDPESDRAITKSNYLSGLNLRDYGLDQWKPTPLDSETGWRLWQKGCEALARNLPVETKVILVKTFQAERYLDESGKVKLYSNHFLDRVHKNNQILEKSYQMISSHLDCTVIDVPQHLLVSQMDESKGFSPSDFGEDACNQMAKIIAESMGLDLAFIPTLENRTEQLFDLFGGMLQQKIPSISELHAMGLRYLERGDVERARKAERLIMLLRNSSVPLSVKMGEGVTFGYDGIGVVVHSQCQIGNFVKIGTNVTLGIGRSRVNRNGERQDVPRVGNRVYISTGAKLLGGIDIGDYSIIGANAVVTNDVPPKSIVAGSPAKVIKTITPENLINYCFYFHKGQPLAEVRRLMFGT